MFNVKTNGMDEALKSLTRAHVQLSDPSGLYAILGNIGVAQTNQRFYDQKDPDGKTWETLQPATIKRKKGRTDRLMDKLDLIKSMGFTVSSNGVFISSSLPDSRVAPHQFGAPKRNIPKRAIFGLSDDDSKQLTAATIVWIEGAF